MKRGFDLARLDCLFTDFSHRTAHGRIQLEREKESCLLAWGLVCLIALAVWRMEPVYVLGYSLFGALKALDVIIIIFWRGFNLKHPATVRRDA